MVHVPIRRVGKYKHRNKNIKTLVNNSRPRKEVSAETNPIGRLSLNPQDNKWIENAHLLHRSPNLCYNVNVDLEDYFCSFVLAKSLTLYFPRS